MRHLTRIAHYAEQVFKGALQGARSFGRMPVAIRFEDIKPKIGSRIVWEWDEAAGVAGLFISDQVFPILRRWIEWRCDA